MKIIWQLTTLLIALALVILSIKIMLQKNDETESVDRDAVVYENIMTRSSVRTYTAEAVSDEMIERMLRAGMAAPTAGNRQPWEFIVIKDKETLGAIADAIKGAHMARKAPMAIAVLGAPEKALVADYWMQDCSAATQNILLAAHGMGLGAVWCGAFPDNGTGKVKKLNELFGLPNGTMTLSIIVVGHPDREPNIHDKWDVNKIHYEKY